MGHLYLHITTDQENYLLIQTHQRKNRLQVHQHNLTPVQTYQQRNAPPLTLRQKWHIQAHMHDMQQGVCGSD